MYGNYDIEIIEKHHNQKVDSPSGTALLLADTIKDLIVKDRSTLEIRAKAIEEGYRPLVIDGFNKIMEGYTTLQELNSKLVIY